MEASRLLSQGNQMADEKTQSAALSFAAADNIGIFNFMHSFNFHA